MSFYPDSPDTLPPITAGIFPDSTSRPLVRNGSRGPAVAEAQQRLNLVHSRGIARNYPPLDACPLTPDGIFGNNTRRAVVSFQQRVFPDQPREWDGVIGSRTWERLVALSSPDEPVTPVIPDLPPTPVTPVINPARWATILGHHAGGRVHLRHGNAVRPLIDGRETFNAMAADMGATNGDRDFIYLLGWDNFDDFPLGAASQFRAIYTAAARRGVEVAAMLWDQPFLN
ncbi:MAG: peptidoglycan-binding protein [Sphingomonadaceae bacterium]